MSEKSEKLNWSLDVYVHDLTDEQMEELLDTISNKVVELGGLMGGGYSPEDLDSDLEAMPDDNEDQDTPIIDGESFDDAGEESFGDNLIDYGTGVLDELLSTNVEVDKYKEL